MKLLKITAFFFSVLALDFIAKSQAHLYFATQAEALWDSSCKYKIRKLTKGECLLIENTDYYKKRHLYATCVKDGKAGFIDKDHVKFEKTYFPDSAGKHPIEFAKKDYEKPFVRMINSSKRNTIKVTLLGATYVIDAGKKEEFYVKPGTHRFKVTGPGYQPLYTQEHFHQDHIVEMEFFMD